MPQQTADVLSLPCDEFVLQGRSFGVSDLEAVGLYRRIMRAGEDGAAAGEDGAAWVSIPDMPITRTEREGATRKFTQRLDGGLETESVILPQQSRSGRLRNTLCVSSQVGCAMGCTFCETAQMGLMRNLDPAEIIAQWRAARFELETEIHNVVFMGMGEPMDNLEAVIRSIRVLVDANGPAIPPSRITVSTVGRPEGIARLRTLANEPGFGRLNLAVSINAPNDEIRGRIMPINRAAPLSSLREAMRDWTAESRRRVLIGYVLIPGVNDAPEHAEELCAYLHSLACTVNVIPYNPRRASPWPAPDDALVDAFVERIRLAGQFVRRRQTMGRDVMAACGQLGNPHLRDRHHLTAAPPRALSHRRAADPRG